MKKVICVLVMFLMIPVIAIGDSANSVMAVFNSNAGYYGAMKLDSSMLTEETAQRVVFTSGDIQIAFASTNGTSFNSTRVICPDSAEFLPVCVCAVMCLNPSTDNVLQSLGNILYSYLSVRGGQESSMGFFGTLFFNIRKEGENFKFLVGEM